MSKLKELKGSDTVERWFLRLLCGIIKQAGGELKLSLAELEEVQDFHNIFLEEDKEFRHIILRFSEDPSASLYFVQPRKEKCPNPLPNNSTPLKELTLSEEEMKVLNLLQNPTSRPPLTDEDLADREKTQRLRQAARSLGLTIPQPSSSK